MLNCVSSSVRKCILNIPLNVFLVINMHFYPFIKSLYHVLKRITFFCSAYFIFWCLGAQWLSGKVLASRPKGRGFEPHRRHCVVSLSKNINPSLVLVQPRKTRPFITERLLMGRKESNQTNNILVFIESIVQKKPLLIQLKELHLPKHLVKYFTLNNL